MTEELFAAAERMYPRPQTFLEMPLVLIPERLFQVERALRRDIPSVKSALNQWLEQAKQDDEALRIERNWIPYAETYIPDTPEGRQFFEVANAFGQIPMKAGIVPRNQNQGYWLKTLHYVYQARGILFAYKRLGVISNPTAPDGLFTQYLSPLNIRNLELTTDGNLALYNLMEQGEEHIRQYVASKNQPYPFQRSLDLLLDVEQQSFLEGWERGPNNKELEWWSIEQQQDALAVHIRLLEQEAWIKRQQQRGTYEQQQKEHLNFLETNGWYGRCMLALRSHKGWDLAAPWDKYIDTLRTGKPAYIDDFYWQGGQPYQARAISPNDASEKTRKTRSRHRVEGTTDVLGYIVWRWA